MVALCEACRRLLVVVALCEALTPPSRRVVVIFGRAGAGKTTVAEAVVKSGECFGVDLDDCVPQWMRDNFAKGIYPTFEERQHFAQTICDYTDEALAAKTGVCIVSFSFVNTDLRDVWRSRFPETQWFLLDTPPAVADDRIACRGGHFYKGAPSGVFPAKNQWEFAPVDFDHTPLDGTRPVSENAAILLAAIIDGRRISSSSSSSSD